MPQPSSSTSSCNPPLRSGQIANASANDKMVLIMVKVNNRYNQRVDLEISDNSPAHNKYVKKHNVQDICPAFNTHTDADIIICFTNHIADGFMPDPKLKCVINVDFDIGAEAMDYSTLTKT
ncbi:hypothetical protein BC938DRAFT_470947 [Jimgerdemannia flammicorona]|uniref:GOLD domain-containing protein n=1 Tax=Jimgerdemannia flammicorona TaxID=994334 RepID=A0A433Q978_9FUNG|nr:hypothetical protein BC938DRAFT_470947 [Jimgerdemannia flammicorona]